MTKINTKRKVEKSTQAPRLAGGFGLRAAVQSPEALLRRSVMGNLLWEDQFYEDGVSVAQNIAKLLPLVSAGTAFDIAVDARVQQKLRHVPLFIAREMARIPSHKGVVGNLLPRIIMRADEIAEFLSIYWKDGKQPISKQVIKGLARSFGNFDEYQLSKYKGNRSGISLRDVMFLTHPTPPKGKEELYKSIANNTLKPPDTWEVGLSGGADKKETFTRLIQERKLGALAFLRNLRLMESVGVEYDVIKYGFDTINTGWLLPINYFAAERAAPKFLREIENMMYRTLAKAPKLNGWTVFIVDVSGSMGMPLSSKSKMTRLDAAAIMAVMASEVCERISLYATAGDDGDRIHSTREIKQYRGFALADNIVFNSAYMGGGGIFTRQCLDHIRNEITGTPDRIIVFSDSQDCDYANKIPAPFGKRNYIVDISAHTRGIAYDGIWDAEISGWSNHFIEYIMAFEGIGLGNTQSDEDEEDEQA